MDKGLFVIAIAALLCAGCLGDDADTKGDGETGTPQLPPGCDGNRLPLVHHVDGRPVTGDAPTLLRCYFRLGTRAVEPTIGIASDGTVFVYPLMPIDDNPLNSNMHVAIGRDEGATWSLSQPQVAGQASHPYTLDPFMFLDPSTDRILAEDQLGAPPACSVMSISDDLAQTWRDVPAVCLQNDHVSIFVGPPVSSTLSGYPNVIYRCSIAGGQTVQTSSMVNCQRSLDGGLLWELPGEPAFTFMPEYAGPAGGCAGGNGHGVTDAAGVVYLPRGHCGQPWLAISKDETMTWERVQVSDLGNACWEEPPLNGSTIGGVTELVTAPLCEHDAGVAVDAKGIVYYSWVDAQRWLRLSHSRDGGRTWSAPLNITAPGLQETALVQMAAGGEGKLAFAYMGTTKRTVADPSQPYTEAQYSETDWDAYMAITTDALSDNPTFQSMMVNEEADPLIRGRCGPLDCGDIHDFIDIRIAPDGTPWAPFVDGCVTSCGDGTYEGVVGRLHGARLWDVTDPNGPYP